MSAWTGAIPPFGGKCIKVSKHRKGLEVNSNFFYLTGETLIMKFSTISWKLLQLKASGWGKEGQFRGGTILAGGRNDKADLQTWRIK